MADLREICAEAGFTGVRTYIQSGNVVFDSDLPADEVKAELEGRLGDYAGKPVGVVVRSSPEIVAVLSANPFPEADPRHTIAIFLDAPPTPDKANHVSGHQDEEIRLGEREIYFRYPSGMGRSKLKIPASKVGTARNMNTIARFVEMVSE